MPALLINTTFHTLLVALFWFLLRFRFQTRATKPANPWRSLSLALSARPVVAVLMTGAAVNLAFAVLAGYINPRDYVQDVVAARQFFRHETLYPVNLPQLGIAELRAPVPDQQTLQRIPLMGREFASLSEPPATANAHPPLVGILLALPVDLFGLRGSFLLIVFLSSLLLWISLVLIVRSLFGPRSRWEWLALAGLVFGWCQVDTTLRGGQPSLFILFIVVAAWRLLRRNQSGPAGALIGLATSIHAFPALLGLWCLIRCRRALVSMLASLLVIAAFIAAVTNLSVFPEWLATIQMLSRLFVPTSGNVSLAGRMATFSGSMGWGTHTDIAGPFAFLAVAGALAWFLPWKLTRSNPDTLDVEYAMFVVAMLLASPISWPRYFPILLLPIAVFLKHASASKIPPLLVLLLVLTMPSSALGAIQAWLLPRLGFPFTWLIESLPTCGLLVLCLWLGEIHSRIQYSAASPKTSLN